MMPGHEEALSQHPDSDTLKAKVVQNLGKGTWVYLGALYLVFGEGTTLFPPRSVDAYYLPVGQRTLHSNMTSVNSVASTGK